LLAAAGIVGVRRTSPALTDRDTILIADFDNTTGDTIFDGALRRALAVALGQSPYLNIAPDDRAQEALRQMGRSLDDPVTKSIAREICQRESLKAFVAGSIATVGRRYLVGLEAINSRTGEVLARAQAEA